MKIDFHTHLFPKDIRDQRERFFPGEPAFELLYGNPKARMAGAQELIQVMNEDGVDVSVIFGFPWQDADLVKRHNDYILESVSQNAKRLLGFCCVDILHPGALDEARRCLDAGMSGLGEIALYRSGIGTEALEGLEGIMALAAQSDVPVVIHTNEPVGHVYPGKTSMTLSEIWALAARFKNNKIVLAHWGGGIFFFSLLKREAKEVMASVYVDTAASPFLYDPEIYAVAAKIIGPEKVLFGTDYPLIRPGRYFKEMEQAGLSAQEMRQICGESAVHLLSQKKTLT